MNLSYEPEDIKIYLFGGSVVCASNNGYSLVEGINV